MRTLRNMRITAKFIVWFLLISLVPLSFAIYVSYVRSRRVLEDEVTRSLLAVADNKANQIESYLQRKTKDAAGLAFTSGVSEAIDKLAAAVSAAGSKSGEYAAAAGELQPMLAYYLRSFGYDEVMLISADGELLLSTSGSVSVTSLYEVALKEKSALAETFIKAKSSQEPEASVFQFFPRTSDASAFVVAPVLKGGSVAGYVGARLRARGLDEFVQDFTGLGATGETIIATVVDDKAVFIAPLRFDPEAAFKRAVPLSSGDGGGLRKAFAKERGAGLTKDYRGKEVLAAWRYLPSYALGMVVKMDAAEVFLSAQKLRTSLVRIALTLLCIVIAAAVAVARSISNPIRSLTTVAKTIAGGELSVRAVAQTADEIGELAASFNHMTDSLVEAKAIVERKNAEVEEQKRLLQEANKELDSFVYTVSHDLRAPLRGVDGFATFLEQDYTATLDEQGKDYLKRIRGGTRRMQQLIDDLLTLSRISRIKNPYADTDLSELLKSILARIEFDIKSRKVELVVPAALPVVRCDGIKIAEVFLNLINNAIKFSSKNTSTPRVEVGFREEAERFVFYVKDNGIGIDPKYHQEVFGIFKRLHKQEEYEGTGAGLSIVKRIVDDHKGEIWIESEAGKGATFFFTIPKRLDEEGPASGAASQTQAA